MFSEQKLTKGHVVIAASHLLESELAQEVLYANPKLFSQGIVVPALRSGFTGFEDFLDSKIAEGKEADQYTGTTRRDMASMLDAEVAMSIRWEVNQTSGWFKERLVSDVRDERSLLRSCLRRADVIVPDHLASKISEVPTLHRKDVYMLAKETGDKDLWNILSNYGDFVYYLSGAKAVDSEGILPQENLMDFSLSDMANGNTSLSEAEVFFKIFVDLVKTATNTHFPVDVLDALSLEDVLELHAIAIEDRFVEKYNLIQEKTKDGLAIHDPERLILLMEELEHFEQELHGDYEAAIDKELPLYIKVHKKTKAGQFLNATASLLISPLGNAQGYNDVIVSGLELAGMGDYIKILKERAQRQLKACKRLLEKTQLDEKPILLNFIKQIQNRYAEKLLGSA